MARAQLSETHLKRELEDFRDRFPRLTDDELFMLWFLRAFVTESEKEAADALTGCSGDKGCDAVLIDDNAQTVFIAQGKYHAKISEATENRADVISFADLAVSLASGNGGFASLKAGLPADVYDRLKRARSRIRRRSYRLHLYYVTTGRCSAKLSEEAGRTVRRAECEAGIDVLGGRQVLLLLHDYLDGVAPPVPSLDLEIESGQGIALETVLHRYDRRNDIDSWVFPMTAQAVADLYERAGPRLFARNVRGFLGSTQINRGMEVTLTEEPDHFWYYNNGITIICDNVERTTSKGRSVMRVANPQVINGQQTTRALHRYSAKADKASVIVRVICVPRTPDSDSDRFETLVSQIVAATNWQNAIRPSDLMSNDRRQIEIERQLRKRGYCYVRKRQTKGEARRNAGARYYYFVKKDELAQAVAGCDLDPSVVRRGKERLFEEQYYDTIFPKSDPNYYLPRYWLSRTVSSVAWGYPQRAYAKWLVLNFMWQRLSKHVRSRAGAEAFREVCEEGSHPMKPLRGAINSAFNAVLAFYRANRGSGATAIDVSTFFQRTKLDRSFHSFWRGSRNRFRNSFGRKWQRFEKALKQEINA